MKLRYTQRAFAEREAIYDYLENQNPEGAQNVKGAISHTIRALALFPLLGRETNMVGIRELIVPRYP